MNNNYNKKAKDDKLTAYYPQQNHKNKPSHNNNTLKLQQQHHQNQPFNNKLFFPIDHHYNKQAQHKLPQLEDQQQQHHHQQTFSIQSSSQSQHQSKQFDFLSDLRRFNDFGQAVINQGNNDVQDKRQPVKLINQYPYNCFVRIKCTYQINSHNKNHQKKQQDTYITTGIGGLIAPGVILTAAHVVYKSLNGKLLKKIQCKFQYSDTILYSQQIITHPSYDSKMTTKSSLQDLAIIILKPNIKFVYPQKCLKIKWNYNFYEHKSMPFKMITYIDKRTQKGQKGFYESDHLPESINFHSILTYKNVTTGGDSGSLFLFKENGEYKVIGIHIGCWGNVNCGLLLNNAVLSPKNIFSQMIQNKMIQQESKYQQETQASPTKTPKQKKVQSSSQLYNLLMTHGNYMPSDENLIEELRLMLIKQQNEIYHLKQQIKVYKQKQRNQRPQQMIRLQAMYHRQQQQMNTSRSMLRVSQQVKTAKSQKLKVKRSMSTGAQYERSSSPRVLQSKRQLNNNTTNNNKKNSNNNNNIKNNTKQEINKIQSIFEQQEQQSNYSEQNNCQQSYAYFSMINSLQQLQKQQNQYKQSTHQNKVVNSFTYFQQFKRNQNQSLKSQIRKDSQQNKESKVNIIKQNIINFKLNRNKQKNQQNKKKQQQNQQQQKQDKNCLTSLCIFFYKLLTKSTTTNKYNNQQQQQQKQTKNTKDNNKLTKQQNRTHKPPPLNIDRPKHIQQKLQQLKQKQQQRHQNKIQLFKMFEC